MSEPLIHYHEFWNQCFANSTYNYAELAEGDWSKVIEKLGQEKVNTVLDLGCGYGHWSIVLARSGFNLTAIDISAVAVKILRNWALKEKLDIRTLVCPVQRLALSGMTYDAVICNSVLDHLYPSDAGKAMENMFSVLKPGGIAYVSFDGLEEDDPMDFIDEGNGIRRYVSERRNGMIWKFYTDEEIKGLCSGFITDDFSIRKNGKRDLWLKKRNADILPGNSFK